MKLKRHTSHRLLRHYKSKLSTKDWNGIIDFSNKRCFNDSREIVTAGRIRLSNKKLLKKHDLISSKLDCAQMDLVSIRIGFNVGIESYYELLNLLGIKDCRIMVLFSVRDTIDVQWIEYARIEHVSDK